MNELVPVPEGYMRDSKERLVPMAQVRDTDKLQDQAVKKIMGYADELSQQIARFRAHTFDDVAAFMSLLAEEYQTKIGGVKGNVTLTSFDGCAKVQVQVADRLEFGPELQVAKSLIDQCVADWSEGARPELRTIIDHAFRTDKEGQVSMEGILSLRRVVIEDERWKKAMDAIGDSIKVTGSKAYVRFYRRNSVRHKWQAVTVDIASADLPIAKAWGGTKRYIPSSPKDGQELVALVGIEVALFLAARFGNQHVDIPRAAGLGRLKMLIHRQDGGTRETARALGCTERHVRKVREEVPSELPLFRSIDDTAA